MAGATIRMTAAKQTTLQEIHGKIHYIEGAELVSKSEYAVNGVTIWLLVYEKYYYRSMGYTSVTVMLTEYEQEQAACIISSGGGSGIENWSLGANRNLAKAFVQALEGCGFSVTDSDLDVRGKGFVERFLK